MNLDQARSNMVEQQIRTWEVLDQDVLDLLYVVPREDFVPAQYRNLAFSDMEVPLPGGERMWYPKMEARVLQELAPRRTERALEIGTGSGYLSALLAHRAAQVVSLEINPALADFGRDNLKRHGADNVTLLVEDGARGHAPGFRSGAPWDVIVLTGSVPVLPKAILDSLAPGGRLFAVVGERPAMSAQLISCVAPGAHRSTVLFETVLAPLVNCERPSRFQF
jgi:protein-L-isoaspartate(D-aspartate) O-methyltransferase